MLCLPWLVQLVSIDGIQVSATVCVHDGPISLDQSSLNLLLCSNRSIVNQRWMVLSSVSTPARIGVWGGTMIKPWRLASTKAGVAV